MLIWVPENGEGVTESVSLGYDIYALHITEMGFYIAKLVEKQLSLAKFIDQNSLKAINRPLIRLKRSYFNSEWALPKV